MKKERGDFPPGPRSWVPGRVFRGLRRDPLGFLTEMGGRYGDLWSFSALGVRYVVVNHPDLVKEVLQVQAEAFWKGPALQNSKGILGEGLLTAEGDVHKQQRRMMTSAFHAKQVAGYAEAVRECTRMVMREWSAGEVRSQQSEAQRNMESVGHAQRGPCPTEHGTRGIRSDMMRLTLLIAGRALFGTLLEKETELVRRSMETLLGGFRRAVVPWGKWLSRLPLKSTRELAQARDDLRGLIGRMIAERHADGSGRHDLMSMLIAATDPESTVRLTDSQLVDQVVTLLTAGHETTANAMSFTLWLLAKHPEEQRRLRADIVAAIGAGDVGAEVMDRVPRIRWVLSESMRVLPPVWTVGRQNQRAIELGGYRLKTQCTVLAPQWVMHQDKRWWGENAGEFFPERWRDPVHPRFAYFPFSTGPRNCIGEAFAWLEMAIALAMLVRDFEFELTDDTPDPLMLMPSITLRPRGLLKLKVTRRI